MHWSLQWSVPRSETITTLLSCRWRYSKMHDNPTLPLNQSFIGRRYNILPLSRWDTRPISPGPSRRTAESPCLVRPPIWYGIQCFPDSWRFETTGLVMDSNPSVSITPPRDGPWYNPSQPCIATSIWSTIFFGKRYSLP